MELIEQGLTRQILGCAIEVHRALGPGMLESAYRRCLARELESQALSVKQETPVPVQYKGEQIESAFRADLVVNDAVLVELKATDSLTDVHVAQMMTYLKFLNLRVGLLVNFNEATLMKGVRRFVL
jgi:GxxExxY protein